MNKNKTEEERRRERDARLAEGKRVAQTLIGRSEKAALRRARKDGFKPEVLPAGESMWLTGDLSFDRIRLYVDHHHQVVRASFG